MSRAIDVLHLLGTAQQEGSGIARIVASLAKELDPQKYRVHAWFLQSDGPLVSDLNNAGASARCVLWRSGSRDPLGAWRFWRQLRSEDFAIVHQHWGARSIRQLIRLGSNAKIIVHSHGQTHANEKDNLDPVAVRGADTIIAVSRSVARQFSDRKVYVIYSGIQASDRVAEDRSDTRKHTIVIGTACRLVEAKGVRDLVLAFAALSKRVPQLRLEIAGSGPEEKSLFEVAQANGIAESVRLLGWRDDLRCLLRTWDIFVLASHDEGFGIAVLEAMMEGLPVVATNVGGLAELVDNQRTGYLVEPEDVDGLHKALLSLVDDREARIRLGAAGRRRAESDFAVGKMVAGIESVYDALTSKVARP